MHRHRYASLVLALLIPLCIFAGNPGNIQPKLNKVDSYEWKFFDVNTIQCTINSAGPYCDYLRTGTAGLFWPKGSGKTAVYTAGLWICGIHHPTDSIRTALQWYQSEFQPGPILSTFNTTTNDTSAAANSSDLKYHLYKINKGDGSLPAGQRNPDYDNWPGDLGAPYIDVNGNGRWDKSIDKPKLWGAQELWCVYNDLNLKNHYRTGTTMPMGFEVQTTYYGFHENGVLDNTMFVRWKIINKSDADYDSVFVSLWSDTDLGDGNDDMIGCDSLLNMVYTYNGDNNDRMYGSRPPADGFILLQGPKVPGGAKDSALSEGRWINGYRDLYAISSVFFPLIFDTGPPLGNSNNAMEAYEFQRGLNGYTHLPFLDPTTGKTSKFVFSGDPVTDSGWTMVKSGLPPLDVRSMISSGPFTLAKGDTQEIVGCFLIAQGSDRLNSITKLHLFANIVREDFYANYNFYEAEEPPVSTVVTPQSFSLSQNFPNPFNPNTKFSYTVPDFMYPYPVRLAIFNTLGQEVAVLVNGPKAAGTYDVVWDASRLPSGIYFCKLSIAGYMETKKMVLLK